MFWYIVRRADNGDELARVNSSIHAPALAKRKANEHGTEVSIEAERHEEEEDEEGSAEAGQD
jgi:hypothetical protein